MVRALYPDHTSKFPELGFYGLPGHSRTPRDVLHQVQDAEALGIGNVMLSERADYKEISAICGACAAVTESICIGTSATNLNIRHPVVTASMATTLNRLSNGRFALGLAKGVGLRWKMLNVPFPTYERELEFIEVMRRLWRGETVDGHAGELGNFPRLGLADYVDEDIPILYVGFGPKSLVNAGRLYDGVHLHTFVGETALSNAVAQVRQGEEEAGRTPGRVKVWSVFATVCDASEEAYLKRIVAAACHLSADSGLRRCPGCRQWVGPGSAGAVSWECGGAGCWWIDRQRSDQRAVVRHRQDTARRLAARGDWRCQDLCGAVAEGIRSRRRRTDYPCQHAGGIRARAARV